MLFVADLGASHEGQDTSHMRLQATALWQTETSEEELLDFFLPAYESKSKEKPGFASVCCLRRLAMLPYHHWSAKENRSNLPGPWDITPTSRTLLSVSLSHMTITDLWGWHCGLARLHHLGEAHGGTPWSALSFCLTKAMSPTKLVTLQC